MPLVWKKKKVLTFVVKAESFHLVHASEKPWLDFPSSCGKRLSSFSQNKRMIFFKLFF